MPRRGPRVTIGVMHHSSDPRDDRRLRLVLDEHERERGELAHELHEQVAQELALVLLGLDRIPPGDDTAPTIASVRELVLEALEHCRALATALRPPLLDQLGLVPALERLAERAGVESVSVDRALSGAALGPALETEVYRCVEAALGDQARSRSVAVSLDPASREVRISVGPVDSDGRTELFETLEARIELIGGTLAATGRELLMRIPLDPPTGRAVAAFPQPARVEFPDGGRRALP
jgi:signal transduction histidine kinase